MENFQNFDYVCKMKEILKDYGDLYLEIIKVKYDKGMNEKLYVSLREKFIRDQNRKDMGGSKKIHMYDTKL